MGLFSTCSLISFIAYLLVQHCSASDVSYADHCASIVPESTQHTTGNLNLLTEPGRQAGFFQGGNTILGPSASRSTGMNFLTIRTSGMARTDTASLFKLEMNLMLRRSSSVFMTYNHSSGYQPSPRTEPDPVNLWLTGFWSETSSKLCMVGTGTGVDKRGKTMFLEVVLKLNYPDRPTITNSLITGTLESLGSTGDPNFFESISVMAFSHMNYVYTLHSEGLDSNVAGGTDDLLNDNSNRPIDSLPGGGLCNLLSLTPNLFHLVDTSSCELTKNCSPFTGTDLQSLSLISFDKFGCEDNRRVRAMINFHNNAQFYRADSLEASLIAEGVWDFIKNQLVFKACRFYNTTGSLYDVSIVDCSIRISWRFPAVWSIKDRSAVVGRIWSTKSSQDMGYFSDVRFAGNEIRMAGTQGLNYEYTEIYKVRNFCHVEKSAANMSRYPNGYMNEMKFGIFVENSEGRFALGSSRPLFVNNYHNAEFPDLFWIDTNSSAAAELQNISYRIDFTVIPGMAIADRLASLFSRFRGQMTALISAEGSYDTGTGKMCMIGCRKIPGLNDSAGDSSDDCEILVKFQFPPLSASYAEGYIKGSIDSLRNRSDPLYFDHLDLSSTAFVSDVAKREVASAKLNMSILILSKILASFSVLVQLHYVRKQPNVLPFISALMLTVLALGFFVMPLLSSMNLLITSHGTLQGVSGWAQVEAGKILIAVTNLVGFLLLLRLHYLTCKSRFGSGQGGTKLWAAEGKSLLSTLLIFITGALIVATVRLTKEEHSKLQPFQVSVLLQDLKFSSTCLTDLFLVPQVFLNIFSNSECSPLSYFFYIGTTLATLIPQLEPVIRKLPDRHQNGIVYLMVCAKLACAVVIYLQQRFGGCFTLSLRQCNPKMNTSASEEVNVATIELA